MADKELENVIDNAIEKAQSTDIKVNESAIASVIEYINNDRDAATEAYNYFKNKIEIDNDKRSATREAMTESLKIKSATVDQLLKLLEIQSKMAIAARTAEQTSTEGINININAGEVRIDKRVLIDQIDRGEI